jgi:homeobox protein cut-like
VEFSSLEGQDEEESDTSEEILSLPHFNAQKVIGKEGKSLEILLATKNKRLQEELTKLRVCFC